MRYSFASGFRPPILSGLSSCSIAHYPVYRQSSIFTISFILACFGVFSFFICYNNLLYSAFVCW